MQNQENAMSISRTGKEPIGALERSASHLSEEGRLANIPAGSFEHTQYSMNPPLVNPSLINYDYANSSTMNMGNQQAFFPCPSTSSAPFNDNLTATMESTNATGATKEEIDGIFQFFAQFELVL